MCLKNKSFQAFISKCANAFFEVLKNSYCYR